MYVYVFFPKMKLFFPRLFYCYWPQVPLLTCLRSKSDASLPLTSALIRWYSSVSAWNFLSGSGLIFANMPVSTREQKHVIIHRLHDTET